MSIKSKKFSVDTYNKSVTHFVNDGCQCSNMNPDIDSFESVWNLISSES